MDFTHTVVGRGPVSGERLLVKSNVCDFFVPGDFSSTRVSQARGSSVKQAGLQDSCWTKWLQVPSTPQRRSNELERGTAQQASPNLKREEKSRLNLSIL